MDDVRRSVLAKAEEVGELRAQTLTDNHDELVAAPATLRHSLDGERLLALGNGGSATDAMDVVADFKPAAGPALAGAARSTSRRTPAILTAIANDIGTEADLARQVIAHGREDDCLLAISTSGNSANVIAALAEALAPGGSSRWRWSVTTAGGWRRSGWPTTWLSRAPSTYRASRRRRRAPTTCCGSSWGEPGGPMSRVRARIEGTVQGGLPPLRLPGWRTSWGPPATC